MSFLLAQSFEQVSNRARFFECLGYFLAVLAFAIVVGGVLWSVRRRFHGRSRFVFTAASMGVLMALLIVIVTGLAIRYYATAPLTSIEPVVGLPPQPVPEPPKTDTLVLQVGADGTLEFNGQSTASDEFPLFMEEAIERWGQQGISLENVTVEFSCDPQLTFVQLLELQQTCQEMGVMQFRIQTAEGGD